MTVNELIARFQQHLSGEELDVEIYLMQEHEVLAMGGAEIMQFQSKLLDVGFTKKYRLGQSDGKCSSVILIGQELLVPESEKVNG